MPTCRVRQLSVLVWLLLSLIPHLNWGQLSIDKVLSGFNLGYNVRLETLFPYQQALLPLGVTSSRSYCEEVGSTWPLSTSEIDCQPRANGELTVPQQEFYALRYLNGHWRSSFTRRYSVQAKSNQADTGLPTHDVYFYQGSTLAVQDLAKEEVVFLHKNFDPIRFLEQQPPGQPETSFFYVLDSHLTTWGDTLAAYSVWQATPAGPHILTLWRRATPLTGHWQAQRYPAQTWEYLPATRQLTCQRSAGGYLSEWYRQYAATGSDYVEVLRESGRLAGGACGEQFSYQAYERQHTQAAGRLVDKYTVWLPNPRRNDSLSGEQVSFTIVMEVE